MTIDRESGGECRANAGELFHIPGRIVYIQAMRNSSFGRECRRFFGGVFGFGVVAAFWCCVVIGPRSAAADTPKKTAEIGDANNTDKRVDPAAVRFFEQDVLPVLKARCFKCHGGESVKGGLRLSSRAGAIKGGDTGPAVDLKQPEKSLILAAINYESYEMPPGGRLPAKELATLTRWIKLGAPYSPKMLEDAGSESHGPPQVNAETKKWWSFQPVRRPHAPKVSNADWNANPIDAFIAHRLAKSGLRPNPPADRVALLRRVTYDLIGLPPTPEDVQRFLADQSDNAWESLVDRLLESPHYGEKWARHWLDLVRYAETNSYERDGAKPYVWRYRDYVIRSLNEDKPYNRFVLEQLAGDEIDEPTADSLIATGYYRLGIWQDEPVDPVASLYNDLDDVLVTTSESMLGLTIGCARCHDHKIDPMPQRDYYRMLAFFRNVRRYGVRSRESVVDASLGEIEAPGHGRRSKTSDGRVEQTRDRHAETNRCRAQASRQRSVERGTRRLSV